MPLEDLRRAILEHVNGPDYRPTKPRGIAERLGLTKEDLPEVRRTIKRLSKEGELAYGANHVVFPLMPTHPAAAKKMAAKGLVGVFRRTASGSGFVQPARRPNAEKDDDVYIAAKDASDAVSGDTVRVRLSSKRGKFGRRTGRITDIVERLTHRFVGTYLERANLGLVHVDGGLFANPIYVGDPGAKGACPDDKVVLDMVRFPTHSRDGEGVIVNVLGARGAPGVDTQSIIAQYGLPGEFPADVLDAARAQADAFDESLDDDREDYRDWTVVTIDPADARDFDDAISLTRLDNGHWQLGVHIADVSHFVPAGSPLDREAHQRSTSVYLPDTVIPMLPEIISNNLASLQPEKTRYAVTALIEFTPEGARVATDLSKSAIRSDRRFSYEEIDDYLANPQAFVDQLSQPVHNLLGQMHELAMILRGRRFERGALEMNMPEVKVELDDKGRVSGAHVTPHTESHQIIEEFMLAANEAVAETLVDRQIAFLRRAHAAPTPRKSAQLTDFVRALGFNTEGLQSRFALQKLLAEAKDDARSYAVNYAVLRSMQRAVYSPEETGHFALASECYCHFTSPIRRYPDLTIHRLVEALYRRKTPPHDDAALLRLGDHCSDREDRATQAERELTKLKLLNFLADKIGKKLDGVITGVESYGIFVMGIELPAEGFVHVSSLADDYYRYDRRSHTLAGHGPGHTYRLGDRVKVEVASVDLDRRELDFRLLGHLADGSATPKGRRRTKKHSQRRSAPNKQGRRKRRR